MCRVGDRSLLAGLVVVFLVTCAASAYAKDLFREYAVSDPIKCEIYYRARAELDVDHAHEYKQTAEMFRGLANRISHFVEGAPELAVYLRSDWAPAVMTYAAKQQEEINRQKTSGGLAEVRPPDESDRLRGLASDCVALLVLMELEPGLWKAD
jgi:hypothetical protein